jgi:hypothetical protein
MNMFFIEKPKKPTKKKKTTTNIASGNGSKPGGKEKVKGSAMHKNGLLTSDKKKKGDTPGKSGIGSFGSKGTVKRKGSSD